MTYTRGEWFIRGTRIMSPERDVFGNETTIVDCRGTMGGEDTQADKVLLCAASKLLSALEDALDTLEGVGAFATGKLKEIIEDSRKHARKAIREAKGEIIPPLPRVHHLAADQDEGNP